MTELNNLENEAARRKTFDSWPIKFISKNTLSKAGFYFLNKDDIVKCVLSSGTRTVGGGR